MMKTRYIYFESTPRDPTTFAGRGRRRRPDDGLSGEALADGCRDSVANETSGSARRRDADLWHRAHVCLRRNVRRRSASGLLDVRRTTTAVTTGRSKHGGRAGWRRLRRQHGL